MKTASILFSDIKSNYRVDSKFHFSRNNPVAQELHRGAWEMQTIADGFGRENIWTGNIFGRIYTDSAAHGKPLLVPYDLFRYVPWSDKILSRDQVKQFDRLQIKRGWLFLVCSGRNLGPVTIADAFCERFVMSHDMVRISVEPGPELFYLCAFLSTRHGQAAIRTDMNGSVIDHTDANQVAAIRYPLVGKALRNHCAGLFQAGFEKRERARLMLEKCHADFLAHFGLNVKPLKGVAAARRFSIKKSQMTDRFDAEAYAPAYASLRRSISRSGGRKLSEIADIRKPFGRYKTNYVDHPDHGIRLMSGRHISQYLPIALKAMNLQSFSDPKQFLLEKGMTLLTADGRAEENLADCVLVTQDRDGWGASGHVHRVMPKTGVSAGLVYLACACEPVQRQLKALATGSVVDALSVSDVGSVTVPYDDSKELFEIGQRAELAWSLFSESTADEMAAVKALETAFAARAASVR